MSFINQNVRSIPTENRPTGLYDDILNVGRILVNNTPPIDTSGVDGDFFIDNSSGDLYGKKSNGKWGPPIYNFSTGGGGTITNLSNIGEGVRSFKGLNGTVAELRTMTSGGNDVIIEEDTPEADSLNFRIADAYKPVLLSGIRDNGVLAVSVGGDTANPNGNLGLPQYPRGSIYIQVGTTDSLWVCNDPVAKVWNKITGDGAGISALNNVGTGVGVFQGLSSGDVSGDVANLRSVIGTADKVDVTDGGDDIVITLPDSYVPVSLDKVTNIQDNRSAPISAPTVNSDSTAGYQKGSIWIEQEISPGTNKLWICNDASIGAASWEVYTPLTNLTPDYTQFVESSILTQTYPAQLTYYDFQATPSGWTESPGRNVWSSSSDGSRVLFTRGSRSYGTEARYKCTYSFQINDSAGATTNDHRYSFRLTRSAGGVGVENSTSTTTLMRSDSSSRYIYHSHTFMFTISGNTSQSFYLETLGAIPGVGAPPPSINTESNKISFELMDVRPYTLS